MNKSEAYWHKNSARYPFQIAVPHMSARDPDPKLLMSRTKHFFLRVPFYGVAHWGFATQEGLDYFKKMIGEK